MKGAARIGLLAAVLAAVVVAPITPGAARDVTFPVPNLEFMLRVQLKGPPLPAERAVPVALHLGGRIRTEDNSRAPGLREIKLEGDRHVAIDVSGLSTCRLRDLPETPPPWDECEDALVGHGYASVETGYPQAYPMDLQMKLGVFNAGKRRGVTKLWIYGYMSTPGNGPTVVPVKIRKVGKGRYGWEAVASVPVLLDGYGSVTDLNLTLQKRIVSASCPNDFLLAATRSTFSDGTVLAMKHLQRCR